MSRKSKSVVQTSESDRKDLSAPETAVSQDAATSTPSGLGGPDGSNPSHTPESEGGDAAGKASAETVKPQDNSGTPSETTMVETGNGQSHEPEAEASASGDSTSTDAARNPLEEVLQLSGCETAEDLVDMALVGRSLMDAIGDLVVLDGPFKDWSPADDPAEIVGDLYQQLLEALADKENAGAASGESHAGIVSAVYLESCDVRVKSDIDGFRRAGHVHTMDWRVFEAGELSVGQLSELIEDPAITIERL